MDTYPADRPGSAFDLIVVCYCQYSPLQAPLKPMPDRQITSDSYGENSEAIGLKPRPANATQP
ncbi:MAG: hypothetical protein J7647_11220 [Cyanobacteria bacterium SBLK]|nr:hypothetical protein [Cyanobacteria bacterium SBLK]